MIMEIGNNLRRRVFGAMPFIQAASRSTVVAARSNKGVVVSALTLIISLICIFLVLVVRSKIAHEAIGFILSEQETEAVSKTEVGEQTRQPRVELSPSIALHTYAMDTDTFIREIRATERLKREIFEWKREGPIEYAKYSPNGNPYMKIMVVGNLHARELFTADIVRLWMYTIVSVHNKPTSNDTVLPSWVFVPVANPCGRDRVTSAYRALMSGNHNRTELWNVCHRGNCDSVDLNRNWITYRSSLYKKTSSLRLRRGRHWDGDPESNPGPEAFSETETKALRTLIHEERPDLLLSVHSGGVGFFHSPEDGETEEELHGSFSAQKIFDLERLTEWSRRKMGAITRKQQKRLTDATLPISGGSMIDYAIKHDVPLALTLEVYVGHPQTAFQREPQDPAYHGREHWGQDPMNCHSFYNPPQSRLLESANSWLRLWQALNYLRGSSRALFQEILFHGATAGVGHSSGNKTRN
jgi:hypothetical protein